MPRFGVISRGFPMPARNENSPGLCYRGLNVSSGPAGLSASAQVDIGGRWNQSATFTQAFVLGANTAVSTNSTGSTLASQVALGTYACPSARRAGQTPTRENPERTCGSGPGAPHEIGEAWDATSLGASPIGRLHRHRCPLGKRHTHTGI
jgi:hypothetical protein